MNKVLEISNLSVGYEPGNLVLDKVNLDVYDNDFLGIIGPNGGGKTTLLKSIMGLIRPIQGEIKFFVAGKSADRINIGYMPQISQIDKHFPISVRQVILSGMTPVNKLFYRYSATQKKEVSQLASQMGLIELLDRPIGNLSGGQLQRVLLARAIIDNPSLLILDEPNSYVDKKFESDFYDILKEINKKMAIILVSHDIGSVVSLVKNIACVNEGLHYHEGANISSEWLEKSYAYPIEIVTHQPLPHVPCRLLHNHDTCSCGDKRRDMFLEE